MCVKRPRPCIHAFSALVNPMFFCFHTQNDANKASTPHNSKYLMRISGLEIYIE